jgi:hypothetical protein
MTEIRLVFGVKNMIVDMSSSSAGLVHAVIPRIDVQRFRRLSKGEVCSNHRAFFVILTNHQNYVNFKLNLDLFSNYNMIP